MIRVVILAVVLGLAWWLLRFLPIGEPFMTIILVIMVLALLYEVLSLAGYVPSVWRRPPLSPAVLCGLSFDLKVFRHRLFEASDWRARATRFRQVRDREPFAGGAL